LSAALHPSLGHVDSLAPTRPARRAFDCANSFRCFPSNGSLPKAVKGLSAAEAEGPSRRWRGAVRRNWWCSDGIAPGRKAGLDTSPYPLPGRGGEGSILWGAHSPISSAARIQRYASPR
jgi:hypothetical protein